eukprot:Opistho-1_new@61463
MAEILHRDRPEIAADKADEADVDHHQCCEHPQRLDPAQRRDDLQDRGRHEGKDRRLRYAARAKALDDRGVREIGDRDPDRDAREDQREHRLRAEHLGDDLLAAVEIAIECALHHPRGDHIARGAAMPRHRRPARDHRPQVERADIGGVERLGKPAQPEQHDDRHHRQHDENRAPARHRGDPGADRRRDDRYDHEDEEDQRQPLRHRIAREQVADHRDHNDAERRADQSVDEAEHEQHREAGREAATNRECEIGEQRGDKHTLAPEPVRQRAIKQRAEADTEQVYRNDMLTIIGDRDAQRLADRGQCGQHRIDGKRVERHDHRHHDHHLTVARQAPLGGLGRLVHGGSLCAHAAALDSPRMAANPKGIAMQSKRAARSR